MIIFLSSEAEQMVDPSGENTIWFGGCSWPIKYPSIYPLLSQIPIVLLSDSKAIN